MAHLISDSAQNWNVDLSDVLKASTNVCLWPKQNQNKVRGVKAKNAFLSPSHRIPSSPELNIYLRSCLCYQVMQTNKLHLSIKDLVLDNQHPHHMFFDMFYFKPTPSMML